MKPVRKLMASMQSGVTFSPSVRKVAGTRLQRFNVLNTAERLLDLLGIFCLLGQGPGIRLLSKPMSGALLNRSEEVRITQAFKFLNENLTDPISQADVARSVRLSSPAFSRLFKKTTGKCFMQVVHELRIAEVCRLLLETSKTTSEIAFGCGYESLSSFHCQFRRIMKASPGQYREKCEKVVSGMGAPA
jgi:AraC-like DNA-binding protein